VESVLPHLASSASGPRAPQYAHPLGPQPTHDDRLLSANLVAELGHLPTSGKLALGTALSVINRSPDPSSEVSTRVASGQAES